MRLSGEYYLKDLLPCVVAQVKEFGLSEGYFLEDMYQVIDQVKFRNTIRERHDSG